MNSLSHTWIAINQQHPPHTHTHTHTHKLHSARRPASPETIQHHIPCQQQLAHVKIATCEQTWRSCADARTQQTASPHYHKVTCMPWWRKRTHSQAVQGWCVGSLAARDPGDDNREFNAAYRRFIFWQHGALSPGNRAVISRCCVCAIRGGYPDHNTGFIPGHQTL